jgi:CRISPR-associated protein (TIGR02710 family)
MKKGLPLKVEEIVDRKGNIGRTGMKAMIISVGGTPEPIVASLLEHKPDFVCFLVSQQSVDILGEVKNITRGKDLRFEDYKVICDDADDLLHCYERAVECAMKIAERPSAYTVVVDYTGGTKTMTAALALATVGHGYKFSYVGGKQRTKNGLGVVVTGTEVVGQRISPWQIFAVEEKRRISLFVSSFQYEAAISTMSLTIENLPEKKQEVWKAIAETLKGYLAWDNFSHGEALKNLQGGLKRLELCARFGMDKSISEYLEMVRGNFADLNEMNGETGFFKKLHSLLVWDLVSNAKRRYLQNKYDDAVARLYRALEMVGQIDFQVATGCSTSDADPAKLPEAIREEYVRKYKSLSKGKLEIPLFGVFRALKEMNRPVGHLYFENEEVLKKMLSARNDSILAHGVIPTKKKSYEDLSKIVQDLFVQKPLVEFPRLNW